MLVAFVGSNPSECNPDPNIAFVGTRSYSVLSKWLDRLLRKEDTAVFFNVSNVITKRKLRVREYQLDILQQNLRPFKRVVALGETAADALTKLKISHFPLPHPSPRNRVLNNKKALAQSLGLCKTWIYGVTYD